jgi:iron complex transport system ATP-binding protein
MVMHDEETPALLQVRNVSFGYGKRPLLYDISLRIEAGEMVGLLGPNGSGKTTLLRLLSNVLQPRQGNVLLNGRDLRKWGRRVVARRIAVVPQELHVPFAFSVEHMVGLGRTPFVEPFLGTRSRHDQEVVRAAMEGAGVLSLAEHVFNELSGGERQRVVIAMALAQEPLLLLLDEPTSHLDIRYQVETLELVQRLNRERGVTVVAALHDLNLASRYFPRLLLFQRGVVADGGPAEVLEAGLLRRVYGVDVQVGILRGSAYLSVLPPGGSEEGDERERPRQPRVHVMAGGGTGEVTMRALADAHIPFSAGALNVGDSDHTLALSLAAEVITEQPYAPISPAALEKLRTRLAHASLLILCPAPIGPGNIALLRAALAASAEGIHIVMITPSGEESICAPGEGVWSEDGILQRTGVAARDYTGGEGLRLIEQLLQAGAAIVGTVGEVVEIARRYATSPDETGVVTSGQD